jgi:hypothetical protein
MCSESALEDSQSLGSETEECHDHERPKLKRGRRRLPEPPDLSMVDEVCVSPCFQCLAFPEYLGVAWYCWRGAAFSSMTWQWCIAGLRGSLRCVQETQRAVLKRQRNRANAAASR